jgi:pyruvate kinase
MKTVHNRTKIVATLGPASSSKEVLLNMIKAGVDVCRLNFSHGSQEDHQKVIDVIREINEKYKTNVGILADLQGPKIRIGKVVLIWPVATRLKLPLKSSLGMKSRFTSLIKASQVMCVQEKLSYLMMEKSKCAF